MQSDEHVFIGMKRDVHPIRQESQFLWNAFNIRITRRDNDTQLSITNEKSPKEIKELDLKNLSYIGHCVLGKYLVLFMRNEVSGKDSIIRCIEVENKIKKEILFVGNLGFSKDHPIQTIGIAEQNLINKIYWVDGINNPRVINISLPELKEAKEYENINGYTKIYSKNKNNTIFDFSPLYKIGEEIICKPDSNMAGIFPSGVIQYVFTYFFKYGQETNIIHVSQLIPLAEESRGGEPGKTVSTGIKITINNYDVDFDYIRIYSILRTSIDSTPITKKVVDISIEENIDENGNLIPIIYNDLGNEGEIIDPTKLLYTGSKNIIPECIYTKENTLFLGNITYKRKNLKNIYVNNESIILKLRESINNITCVTNTIGKDDGYQEYDGGDLKGLISAIEYKNIINLNPIGFKTHNIYRLGIQFQYETGEWSEPVFIGDKQQTRRPDFRENSLITPAYKFIIPNEIKEKLIENKYIKARPLVVLPKINERVVLAQGILCPTVFRIGARDLNAPFSQSSWFIRPTMTEEGIYGSGQDNEYNYRWEKGSPTQWKHLHPLMCFYKIKELASEEGSGYEYSFINGINPRTVEIQNTIIDRCSFGYTETPIKEYNAYSNKDNDKWGSIRYLQKGWREIPYIQKVAFIKGRYNFTKNGKDYREYFDEPIFDDRQSLTDYDVSWNKRDVYGHATHKFFPDWTYVKKLNKNSFNNQYFVDRSIVTMHSPDIEFNDLIKNYIEINNDLDVYIVGSTTFIDNYGDIRITTGSATIGDDCEGFVHQPIKGKGSIVAGLFYRDRKADDSENGSKIGSYRNPRGYMVHLWNCDNSLNNDINRINVGGTRTSVLKTKVMGNVKSCSRTWWFDDDEIDKLKNGKIHLFNSNDITMIKLEEDDCIFNESIYYGNIDDVSSCNPYYAKQSEQGVEGVPNEYNDDDNKLVDDPEYDINFNGLLNYIDENDNLIGDYIIDLKKKTDVARIRYKSTPHVVFALNNKNISTENNILPSFCDSKFSDIFSVHSMTTKGRGGGNGTVSPLMGINLNGIYTEEHGLNSLPDGEGDDRSKNHAPYLLRNSDVYWNTLKKNDSNYYDEYNYSNYKQKKLPQYISISDSKLSDLHFEFTEPDVIQAVSEIETSPGIGGNIGGDKEEGGDLDIPGFKIRYCNNPYPSSWIAELRQKIDINSIFGGSSNESLKNNLWLIAGESINLEETSDLIYKWGDTWYQQFEMLKTYAFSNEDANQVIEIGRFLCESYINIGGRYDRNQGNLSSILYANPTNFNLINPVYSQLNNFFTYRILDDDYYKNQKYGNQILVSSSKINGDITDSWTHVHAATTLDLDNKLGDITSINSNNDTLIAFQEKGMSHILFNSRIQVNASDGVPIEIANSQKVDGYRIISDSIGCLDKFAIAETPSGIYFADANTKNIYRFGEGIENLSASLGTMYWLKDINYKSKWFSSLNKHKDEENNEPKENGIRLSFDSLNNDVYFIPGCSEKKNNALCFSGLLNQFVSFYPYSGSILFNWNKKTYGINGYRTTGDMMTPGEGEDNLPTPNYVDKTCLYEMFADNERCKGFDGNKYPFEFSFISNKDPLITKIFDTIEYEGSVLDDDNMEIKDSKDYSISPIDSLQVDNEYQDTEEWSLNNDSKKLDIKKKFRIWRMIVPRNSMKRMERIRNPWTKITLKGINNANKKCIIHNISVKYSV